MKIIDVFEDVFVDQHAGLDISRIKEDTGWEPRVDLNDMIRKVFELLFNNGDNR